MGGRGGGSSRASNAAPAAATGPKAAAPAAPASNEQKVTSAYNTLKSRFDNDWVILTELRQTLSDGGMGREEQDRTLMSMVRAGAIRLIPEENQKTLRPQDRAASIRVGGEDKHLIGINVR